MTASPLDYRSTRAAQSDASVSYAQALLQGLAPDGGLFIPTRIPTFASDAWQSAESVSEVAVQVLTPWLSDEVSSEVLTALCHDAFSFPVPLVPLKGEGWDQVYVLELFHGPTLSFKDFGARMMARLMNHFLGSSERRLTILVATSGDTGSAVADGFAGLEHIDVVLLYPDGQVSPVQEQQLIVQRPNVQSFAVQGTFDDCQRLVKAAFVDPDLAPLNLSSANSINMGRLLPQMVYYVWAAAQDQADDRTFCVPSGNLGNLTAGMLARTMGVPVQRMLAAHNANDAFPRFLRGDSPFFGASRRTLSNAMDVGDPSNFERLHHLFEEEDLRAWIWGTSVDDEATIDCMRRVYQETGYVACPHTAVGLKGVEEYRTSHPSGGPYIVLGTAHPAKFPAVVEQALGKRPETPERLAALDRLPTNVHPLHPTLEALKSVLLTHA